MATGLVLVKLTPGEEKQALENIKKISGVKDLTATFGSWDVVVKADASSLETLASVVVGRIRAVRGVAGTETLIEVKLE